jgi:hypothetical protein
MKHLFHKFLRYLVCSVLNNCYAFIAEPSIESWFDSFGLTVNRVN